MTSAQAKSKVQELISNGYAETHLGYHSEYRFWHGTEQRGCYAQIAAPYGGTVRIYERSYPELLVSVNEYLAS